MSSTVLPLSLRRHTRLVGTLIALAVATACTPHFNREGQKPSVGLSLPVMDLATQGGASTAGVTSHYRVSRVTVGGNFRRIQATTPDGHSVQAGPGAPH